MFDQHLSKSVATKAEHYNLPESRIYCRPVALDCISFSKVYLITWKLSVIL